MLIVGPPSYISYTKEKFYNKYKIKRNSHFISLNKIRKVCIIDGLKNYIIPINIIDIVNAEYFVRTYICHKNFMSHSKYNLRPIIYKNYDCHIYRSAYYQFEKKGFIKLLHKLKINSVIDLRAYKDFSLNNLLHKEQINYYQHSFYENISIPLDFSKMMECISKSYLGLIKQYKDVYCIMKELIYCDNNVLIFCKYGKDRTGIISVLLQLLNEDSEEHIVLSYLMSFFLLKKYYKKHKAKDYNHYVNRFPLATEMITFLNVFKTTYGTITNYLLLIGLSAEEILILKDKVRDE